GKASAARVMLEEEPPEVIVGTRRQRAAALGELRGREAQLFARLFERLRLDAVAVGRVEQLGKNCAQGFGQREPLQLVHPGADLLRLLALPLEPGERRLERIGRRRLEAPFAL